MEVILKKDVQKLGKAGSVVKVKDGFARNFLFAGGLAVPVTAAGLKKLEEEKQARQKQDEQAKQSAEELKKRLEIFSLTISALAQEDEKLYGSIGNQEICLALAEEGFSVDKNMIELSEPIKSLGIYEVLLKLHPEVEAKLKIWVVKK